MSKTMRRRLRLAGRDRADTWIVPAALGAAAGVLVGWMLGRPTSRRRDEAPQDGTRLGERLSNGLGAALEGLREIHARFVQEEPPEIVEIEARLALVEGAAGIRVAHLGDGILELTGSGSDETARAAAAAVARVAGVHAVVNRVWTPSSAAPPAN